MRLALDFGVDNCVRLRVTSEPKAKKKGDGIPVLTSAREYAQRAELNVYTDLLRQLDYYQSDEMHLTDMNGVERLVSRYKSKNDKALNISHEVARLDSLDLLNESQRFRKSHSDTWGESHKPTVFGRKAIRTIRECGTVLDNDYKGGIYLVTCTLPSDGYKQIQLLAAWSGYIINRLFRKLRNVEGLQYYFVWEWQKRGALHLHLVVAHENPEISGSAAYRLRTHWFAILKDLSANHDIDMFASSRAPGGTWRNKPNKWQWSVDKIEKSVTGYLSKYLSKGAMGVSSHFYPSRWWGCCSSLRAAVKSLRVAIAIPEIYNDVARRAFYSLADLIGGFAPDFILPFEHYVYNKQDGGIDPESGDRIQVDSSSVMFSLIGINFYFNPAQWRELYHVFRAHFSYGSLLSIIDLSDSADDFECDLVDIGI